MNKIEKIFEIICWIIVLIVFAMITWFVVMFVMLVRYDKCKDLDFQPPYCEKYKNF